MKLYYMPGACSLAAHIVLQWLGKPYETQKMAREELKQPAFLAINPLGAVPALTVDDWHLTQNVAVLQYLADLDPTLNLQGQNTPRAHAEVRRWLGFINADVHKTFSLLFGTAQYVDDPAAQATVQANASKRLTQMFKYIDEQLDDQSYLTGDRKTIADAYLFVVLRWAHAKKVDLEGMSHLHAFFEHMTKDAGVQAAMKAEGLS